MGRRGFLLKHHFRREMSVSQDLSERCHVDYLWHRGVEL